MMDISPCRLATMRHHDRDYQNDPIDRPVSWVVSFSRKWLRFVAAAGPNRTFRPEHRDLDTTVRRALDLDKRSHVPTSIVT